jgi:hypothetical protein
MTIKLVGGEQRLRATQAIHRAPAGYVVTIREPNRTLDQNAKMHAMIADVMRQVDTDRKWTADEWKDRFLHALGKEMNFLPDLDGRSFFPRGYRSSLLSKADFADLVEIIYAFGAEHNVKWSEPEHAYS